MPGGSFDPFAGGCFGPVDPRVDSPEGAWMRGQLVPYLLGSDDPDEMETFSALDKILREPVRLDRRSFLYGEVYLGAVALAEGAAALCGVLPRLPRRADLLSDPILARRVYVVGRLVSVLAGVALIAGLGLLVRRLAWGPAAVLAGTFGILGPLLVAGAHVAKPHVLAGLFALLTFATGWAAARRLRPAWGAAHGALLAVAASASPPAVVLAACYPTALAVARPRPPVRRMAAVGLAALAAFLGGLVVLNPLALARPDLFLANARLHLETGGWSYGIFSAGKLLAFARSLMIDGLPLGAVPIALAGIVACALRRRAFDLYLLVLTLLTGLVYGGFIGILRIALPLLPLVGILVAAGTAWISGWRRAAPRRLGLAVVAVLLAVSAAQAAAFAASYLRPDGRDAAGRFLDRRVPAGACVALRTDMPMATFMPRFALGRYRLDLLPADVPLRLDDLDADVLVLTSPARRADPWLSRPVAASRYSVVGRFPAGGGPPWPFHRWRLRDDRQVVVLQRRVADRDGAER